MWASHTRKGLHERRDRLKEFQELPQCSESRIYIPQISDESQNIIIFYGREGKISNFGCGLTNFRAGSTVNIFKGRLGLPCYPLATWLGMGGDLIFFSERFLKSLFHFSHYITKKDLSFFSNGVGSVFAATPTMLCLFLCKIKLPLRGRVSC